MQVLKAQADLTITSSDNKNRETKFSNDDQVASLQATLLGDQLCQLVVASSLTGARPDRTSVVVEGAMKVCHNMHVPCALSRN